MELEIIRLIQTLRNPVFDFLFYWITQLGDQIFFIAVAVIIYWTIDKKFAHKFVFAFMISAVFNTALKLLFKRIRPFYYQGISSEPNWRTTGYAFPSGHAQAAGVLGYTGLYAYEKKKIKGLNIVAWFILIAVPFSRMYLGQHFLSDVVVGVILAIGLTMVSFKLAFSFIHHMIFLSLQEDFLVLLWVIMLRKNTFPSM